MPRFVLTLLGSFWMAVFALLAAAAASGAGLRGALLATSSREMMLGLIAVPMSLDAGTIAQTGFLALAGVLFLWATTTALLNGGDGAAFEVARLAHVAGGVILAAGAVQCVVVYGSENLSGLTFLLAALAGSFLILSDEEATGQGPVATHLLRIRASAREAAHAVKGYGRGVGPDGGSTPA